MIINDQIRDEKLQYDINRKAAKISALYILLVNFLKSQVRFTYSSLGKAFEKQTKTIEDQVEKQLKA